MKYYLYRTVNLVNGNYYIGVHGSNNPEQDDYFGSGTLINKAVKKYGRDNFRTDILEYFDTWEKALAREKEVVNSVLLEDPKSYNLIEGGTGVCKKPVLLQSPEGSVVRVSQSKVDLLESEGYVRANRIRLHKGSNEVIRTHDRVQEYLEQGWSLGPTDDHCRKISDKAKGRTHTLESRLKISKALKGRKCSDEHRKHNSEAKRGVPNYKLRGRQVSETTRKKLSEAMKNYFNSHPERRQVFKGRVYINNGDIAKRVYPEELETYLKGGWVRGNVRFCYIRNSVTGERKKVREKVVSGYLNTGWVMIRCR